MKVGIVLSGGMAKGAYQIGALRAVNEFIPLESVKYVSGASVGALNGYAYSTGNLDGAEALWRSFCNEDDKLVITKVLRSRILQDSISSLLEPENELSPSFYTTLLDFTNKNVVYKNLKGISDEEMPLYLKASVAMPVYNKPIKINDTDFFDGAMVDNIPVFPLLKHEVDYIVCIYFDDVYYKFENAYFDNKIIKLTFPCQNRIKQSLFFTKDSIDEMIEVGYEKTHQVLSRVFARGCNNMSYIRNTIEEMNKEGCECNYRVTGDVLVTNLNKITQRLTKRKISG